MENSVLSPVAVQTINLTRHFGDKVAVDQLNLAVAEGEFFGFLGPNGAESLRRSTCSWACCGPRPAPR